MIENITPKFSKKPIKIVGCGLAGAEIAFILANNGFDVHIFLIVILKIKKKEMSSLMRKLHLVLKRVQNSKLMEMKDITTTSMTHI